MKLNELRRSAEARVHKLQHQNSLRGDSSYRSSSNSTPEPKTYPNVTPPMSTLTNGHHQQHQQQQRNPLLQSLADHANMSSASAGSTTSSTATTATATTIGRVGGGGGGGGSGGGMGEVQFDDREIFYVSPTKRKGGGGGGGGGTVSAMPLRSSLRHSDRFRSFSPTAATIAPAYPPITPAAAYSARAAGDAHDLSFDSYEISSHYSDTAMQLLRSGSCSGVGSLLGNGGGSSLLTSMGGGGGGGGGGGSSSSSSLALQQPQSLSLSRGGGGGGGQNNVVTFSNYVSEQPSTAAANTTTTAATRAAAAAAAASSLSAHRGSLRRSKGRSNQSLCSCDAGDDTEINPDPTRPLYQYSLERRHKTHTYTCEQNAQILLRLQRERIRRLSLGASRDDVQSDTPSSSDVDTIPPVPPPPSMKRNASLRSLRFLQHQQQQQQQQQQQRPSSNPASDPKSNANVLSTTTPGAGSSGGTAAIAMLCNGDMLNDCVSSAALDLGVMLDNCTTSILKCATTTTGGAGGAAATAAPIVASLATMAATNAKPDVCHVGGGGGGGCGGGVIRNGAGADDDDIFTPSMKKSDPSLCFLHTNTNAVSGVNGMVALTAAPELSHSQRDLRSGGGGNRHSSSTFSLSKYNTIGPSSDCARQLAQYTQHWQQQQQQQQQHQHQQPQHQQQLQQQQQQQQQQRITNSCRCFSQSLSNFTRDYFGQQQQQQQQRLLNGNQRASLDNQPPMANGNKQNQKYIYHTGDGEECNWLPPPPAISRSYSNLIDSVDSVASAAAATLTSTNNRFLHHNTNNNNNSSKLHQTSGEMGMGMGIGIGSAQSASLFGSGGNCSSGYGAAASLLHNASFTTLSSSNSGLKEKYHQQQQQQQQHHLHPHAHEHLLLHGGGHHDAAGATHHPHQHSHHLLLQSSGIGHHGRHTDTLSSGGGEHQQQHQQHKHHQLHASVSSIMPWKHRQCPSRGSSSSGTNSFRFDAAKHWLAVSSILLIIGAASVAVPLALRVAASAPFEERLRVAVQLLDQVPLIDGHNDLPWNIRKFLHNKLNDFNFDEDLRNVMPWARSHWSHTDLQRLKKGRVAAQFWAAYVPCEAQHRDAVQLTLEQIDVIKRLTDRYSPQLTTCTTADDIEEAHKNHQLCSLTGVEGGHSLGGSLAVLRTLYAIGVRYMTLTSTCHTPWADSSYADAPTFNVKHGGLTLFGKTIIREMNRLGMMVDLSHVSTGTMRDAIKTSEAPVIFSHSSAYELCNSSRNVQNDMLLMVKENNGLVMVNFYSKFLSCSENSTVHDAVAHINHIKNVAGIDHVGLGAGYDGINFTPKGLEDVSSYPTLFAELLGEGWSMEDLTKLAGGNFLRVMRDVEKVRDVQKAAGVKPFEDHPNFRSDDPYNCTSS